MTRARVVRRRCRVRAHAVLVGHDEPGRAARRAAVPRRVPDAVLRVRAGDRVRRAADAQGAAGAGAADRRAAWRGRRCGRSAATSSAACCSAIGWAVADVCPGPIAAQLGQGVPWALATLAGLVIGPAGCSAAVAAQCRIRALGHRVERAPVAGERERLALALGEQVRAGDARLALERAWRPTRLARRVQTNARS